MSTNTKRAALITLLSGTLLVIFGFLAASASRPAMPKEWSRLRVGMPRADVLAILPDEIVDLRELKRFDSTRREVKMLGARSSWLLLISYDSSGKVESAEASFTHEKCGIFNTRKKIL